MYYINSLNYMWCCTVYGTYFTWYNIPSNPTKHYIRIKALVYVVCNTNTATPITSFIDWQNILVEQNIFKFSK